MNKNLFRLKKLSPLAFGLVLPLMVSFPVFADDTEIFFSASSSSSSTKPNILLLLDTSGSMDRTDDGETDNRLTLMQNALNGIIDGATNVNVGLARFTDPGGAIVYPIIDVNEDVCTTVETCVAPTTSVLAKQRLRETITNFRANSITPLVTSMLEATRYFRGEAVVYGKTRGDTAQRNKRVSHPDTYTGGTLNPSDRSCTDTNSNACEDEEITGSPIYTSPITENCQSNHLVVLSDGVANQGNETEILNMINSNNGSDPSIAACDTSVPNNGARCGKELAAFLKSYDQNSTYTDSKVTTHTIGFASDITNDAAATAYMQDVATAGGGIFRPANNAADLVNIFNEIINVAKETNSSFSIPSIKVNQVNRISNSDEIYMALFKPTSTQNWAGNIKRYSLKPNTSGILTVYDSNNNPAIDATTLTFKDTARSFWSSTVDGNETNIGGAAEKLTASRTIYSNLSTNNNLSATTNTFNNTNISTTDLTASDNADRDAIINWAKGSDNGGVSDAGQYAESLVTGRQQMGAPLHSEPVIVSYDDTITVPDTTLYFGTNEGYLHAIDTSDGSEEFSFIPKILLPNLKLLKENTTNNTGIPVYGVDGAITVWRHDATDDKKITGTNTSGLTDDHVILYTGLRRGGRSYFALDVTVRGTPKILWTIDNNTTGFENLGQSWSRPILTDIDLSTLDIDGATGKTKVIIFAGGYDPAQDTKTTRSADTMGSSIYIVNALTGYLIWSGGVDSTNFTTAFTEMNYSIPSNLAVVDVDQDGLADLMYVGDMGGQLWRFDFNGEAAGISTSVSDLVTGGVVADINAGDIAGNRRFFNTPDVALINGPSGRYITLAIGSGWRAHPLDKTVQNRFYVFKDNDYQYILSSYTKVTETNLYDATTNLILEGSDQTTRDSARSSLKSADGWFIKMENLGEKVLSTALTFENKIIFTTYQPETTVSASACQVSIGTGRFYFMSIIDATPVAALLNSDSTDRANRVKDLKVSALPPSPQPIFTDDNIRILVGTEELPIDIEKKIIKTHWRVKE